MANLYINGAQYHSSINVNQIKIRYCFLFITDKKIKIFHNMQCYRRYKIEHTVDKCKFRMEILQHFSSSMSRKASNISCTRERKDLCSTVETSLAKALEQ